jgi:hypothetical protein
MLEPLSARCSCSDHHLRSDVDGTPGCLRVQRQRFCSLIVHLQPWRYVLDANLMITANYGGPIDSTF